MFKTFLIAGVSALAFVGAAEAQVPASASTDMSLRAGPGEEFDEISAIPAASALSVMRCTESGLWCEVAVDDMTGWAYAELMAVGVDDQYSSFAQALTEGIIPSLPRAQIIAELDDNGGMGDGAEVAATDGDMVMSQETLDYVTMNPVQSVTVEGDVMSGTAVPADVDVYQVPNDDYYYAYFNDTPVLIDPETREVVYIVQ